jgi:serine protease Do
VKPESLFSPYLPWWIGGAVIIISAVGLVFSPLACSPVSAGSAQPSQDLWSEGILVAPVKDRSQYPSFAELAKALIPAVVNISTIKKVETAESPEQREKFRSFLEKYFGGQQAFRNRSLGSGFIINQGGYILTNSHVIEDTDNVLVTLYDKREYRATVVGRDEKTDIALIKITPPGGLPIVNLGNSDKLEIGDWVMAIGNPFGYSHSVTAGIVSAKGREIGAGPYDNFIQTDASINPGNSGGPLFNIQGEVVGINTAIVSPGQGIGFAIPVNMVKALLPQMEAHGRVIRGWLGVNIQEVDHKTAKEFGLPGPVGALVTNVFEDNPAFKAGVQEGDIVISFNHRPVDGVRTLQRAVASVPVGNEVEIEVLRDGEHKRFRVTLEERQEMVLTVEQEIQTGFGMKVEELTETLHERYSTPQSSGMVVTWVDENSAAFEAGLEQGDVILEVNSKPVKNLKEYLRHMRDSGHSGRSILLFVQRADKTLYLALDSESDGIEK